MRCDKNNEVEKTPSTEIPLSSTNKTFHLPFLPTSRLRWRCSRDECIIKESSPEMQKIDRKREWSIISEWNAFAIVLFHSALWRIFSYHINPFIIGLPMPLFKAIRYPSGKYTALTLPSAMPMDMPDVLDFRNKSFRNTTSTKVLKCAAKNNIFFQMEFFNLQKKRSRKAKLCKVEKKCWCQK